MKNQGNGGQLSKLLTLQPLLGLMVSILCAPPVKVDSRIKNVYISCSKSQPSMPARMKVFGHDSACRYKHKARSILLFDYHGWRQESGSKSQSLIQFFCITFPQVQLCGAKQPNQRHKHQANKKRSGSPQPKKVTQQKLQCQAKP